MQFEKCLTCPAIKEQRCAGPNYMAMNARVLVAWALEYQRLNGITNAQLSEHSGIPKGTIDGIKYRVDVRHDTISPLIQALIEMTGGTWGDEPCAMSSEDIDEQQDKVRLLEAECLSLRQTAEHERELLDEKDKRITRYESSLSSMERALKYNRVAKSVLSVLCAVLSVFLTVYIAIDFNNMGIGFVQETISPVLFILVAAVLAAYVVIATLVARAVVKRKE